MLVREGRDLPAGFRTRPTLADDAQTLLHEGFWELSTDRQAGFAEGPIPWSSIARFADREGLAGLDFADFRHIIRALDRAYLLHRAEERENLKEGRT